MELSIIMPVYIINSDLGELTFKAWESLKNVEAERIMVDNGSTIKPNYDTDIMIRNKENLGFAPAVNQALALASGEWVAIANNDIKVSSNWWKVAEPILQKNDVASVHFRVLPYESEFTYGNDTWVGGKERWCTSSFFVARRSLIAYDPFYGKGSYDDYDLWHRVRSNGSKQAYTNKACYLHKFSATFNAVGQDKRDEVDAINYERYKNKWGEYPDVQFANEFTEQMKEPYYPFP